VARYIHEQDDWPNFKWKDAALANELAAVRHRQGLLLGRMQVMGFHQRELTALDSLTDDVQKSSEIEGEHLDRLQVRSSLARRLGIDVGALVPADRQVEGVVEMILDAMTQFDTPLTAERLFGWHASLFPTGRSGMWRIRVGAWREDNNGPMQVVSGGISSERVHYEAPAASALETEMTTFLNWFEGTHDTDRVIKAALAHLWFVMIHPFEDGNGRIARAVADLALARSELSGQRYYSMSAQILKEKNSYYDVLEKTGKGTVDVTLWISWFLRCLDRALAGAEATIDQVVAKAKFWDRIADVEINERQRLMLNKLLDGFEGKLTTVKWSKIAKCSHDTALRDIQDLIGKSVLEMDPAGGRSSSYSLRFDA